MSQLLGLSLSDWLAVVLTFKLALVVTVILLVICLPLAWWLVQSQSRWRAPVAALVAMPLVLPPTVLGFYLLLLMGPEGTVGRWVQWLGLEPLVFSFSGLVIASCIYSLPFVVQPIYHAMQGIGRWPLEVAASLGAGPFDRFFTVVLPLVKRGIITAAILGFAHTVGEFGVVLMIGGSIPESTRVLSIQIYEQVETLNYAGAHRLSALLVVVSFLALWLVYRLQNRSFGQARAA